MERAIDSTFDWKRDGIISILQVTEQNGCEKCAFKGGFCQENRPLRGECESGSRSDRKSIQFVEIKKTDSKVTYLPIGTITESTIRGTVMVVEAEGCRDCIFCNYGGERCAKKLTMNLGMCAAAKRGDRKSIQFQIAPVSVPPPPKTKFKVGDAVKIVHAGSGCGGNDVGKLTKIVEIGTYNVEIGYKIDPPYHTNSYSGMYGGMLGEISFELVAPPSSLPRPKFKIGDVVQIIKSDAGAPDQDIGKQARIVDIGTYMGQPGYVIDPIYHTNSSNPSNGYGGMVGESSFRLVDSYPDRSSFWERPARSSREGGLVDLLQSQAMERPERVSSQPQLVVPIFITVPEI